MVFPPYLELSPIPVACGHGPVVSRCTHLVALQDPYTLSTKTNDLKNIIVENELVIILDLLSFKSK